MVDATRVTVAAQSSGGGVRRTLRRALWLVGVVAVVLCAAPAVARATEPASTYDTDGQRHNDVCVTFHGRLLDLRYLSGLPTRFELSNALAFTDGSCAAGQIRLDLHEIVGAPSTTQPRGVLKDGLVFHRGGSGYADAENVRYGQVAVSQLNGPLPAPEPSGDNRGAACPTVLDTPYQVSVQPIPPEMKYKSPQDANGNNAGASYLHYGDPAAQQGDDLLNIHYSTLTWSWIDRRGGGHNRILLAPGQDIRLCDVEPIDYPSWAPSSVAPEGQINGRVISRYVQTRVEDGPALYGWMVWQHEYYGGSLGVVDHFHLRPDASRHGATG